MYKRSNIREKPVVFQRATVSYVKVPKSDILAAEGKQKNEAVDRLSKEYPDLFKNDARVEVNLEEAIPEWDDFSATEIDEHAFGMDFFSGEAKTGACDSRSLSDDQSTHHGLDKESTSTTSTGSEGFRMQEPAKEDKKILQKPSSAKQRTVYPISQEPEVIDEMAKEHLYKAEPEYPMPLISQGSFTEPQVPSVSYSAGPIPVPFKTKAPKPVSAPVMEPEWAGQSKMVNTLEVEDRIIQSIAYCLERGIAPPGLYNTFDHRSASLFCRLNEKVFSIFAHQNSIFEPVWFYQDKKNRRQGPFSSYDMDVWRGDSYFSSQMSISFQGFMFIPLLCYEQKVAEWRNPKFTQQPQNPSYYQDSGFMGHYPGVNTVGSYGDCSYAEGSMGFCRNPAPSPYYRTNYPFEF